MKTLSLQSSDKFGSSIEAYEGWYKIADYAYIWNMQI